MRCVFVLPCWECVRVAVLAVCVAMWDCVHVAMLGVCSCFRVGSVFVLPCWECVCVAVLGVCNIILGVCLCCRARNVFYRAGSTRDLLWWDLALLILAQNTRYKTTLLIHCRL